jgi:hypothetical protein
LVPGGGNEELTTPLVDPAEPASLCASNVAGIAARPQITTRVVIEMVAGDLAIGNAPLPVNDPDQVPFRNKSRHPGLNQGAITVMRKLIAFDEDTFDKLKQLGRDRMATFQELADEAFADLLKKHGIPIDLRDALRKSVKLDDATRTAARTRSRKAGS